MNFSRVYGLFLRHFFLITQSFPRILDLIYWPSIQITLWGFISNFFASHSTYYNGGVYTDILQTIYGCDSVINTTLTILPEIINNLVMEICDGYAHGVSFHQLIRHLMQKAYMSGA